MQKNEKMKKAIVEKISLFLNNKYRRVFQDKGFTIDMLKSEISKLVPNKNLRAFNFAENIKPIEKTILKKLTNFGQIKYEPIQMEKINDLLSPNPPPSIPKPPQKNQLPKQKQIPNQNQNQELKQNTNLNSAKENIPPQKQRFPSAKPSTTKTNNNNCEIPYSTELMEKLKERENSKWAIQANQQHEAYLKEQQSIKNSIREKQLKQRQILEQQIKEKKEREQKYKEEENKPELTSLNFEYNEEKKTNIQQNKNNIKRPLSTNTLRKNRTPFSSNINDNIDIEYQKKMNEDLKKYNMEQINNKKLLREKYKEIEKANYEIAQQKKQKKLSERESDKKAMNEYIDYFHQSNEKKDLPTKITQQKNEKEILGINQFTKHQNAINNYEEQKYKREIEEEKKKLFDEEKLRKEKKQKMIEDYRNGLAQQVMEKKKLNEMKNEVKLNENKDNNEINNRFIEERNMLNKQKHDKIINYKRELDEQIEKNKKIKKEEF